jgi:hypothetical protein
MGKLREAAFGNFLFFAKEILGYDLVDYTLPLHQKMALQATARCNTLTLVPRGFLKSTLLTVAGTIWHNLHYPEECVLIGSWTLNNAKKFLSEIEGHYRKNERFRALFPEFCPAHWTEEGTQEQFTLPNRKKPRKEASIEVCGADQTVASRHYEVINVDDAVVKENVPPWATEDTMLKVWEWFRSLRAVLKTVAECYYTRVIGTRWHDGDVYGKIINDTDLARYYQILKIKPRNEDGTPVWPKVFPEDKLLRIRAENGSYLWSCLYEQDPLPPDSAIRFDPSWFHIYDGPTPEGRVAITVDPAFTEKNSNADRSAIAVTVVPPEDGLWVETILAGRWTPFDLINRIVRLWERYHPEWVGMETDGGGKIVYDLMYRYCRDHQLPLRLTKMPTKGKPKPSRISELSGYVEAHGLWYREKDSWLIDEVLRYPVGEHDDVPDALSMRVQRLDRARGYAPVKPKPVKKLLLTNSVSGAELLQRYLPGQDVLRRL